MEREGVVLGLLIGVVTGYFIGIFIGDIFDFSFNATANNKLTTIETQNNIVEPALIKNADIGSKEIELSSVFLAGSLISFKADFYSELDSFPSGSAVIFITDINAKDIYNDKSGKLGILAKKEEKNYKAYLSEFIQDSPDCGELLHANLIQSLQEQPMSVISTLIVNAPKNLFGNRDEIDFETQVLYSNDIIKKDENEYCVQI